MSPPAECIGRGRIAFSSGTTRHKGVSATHELLLLDGTATVHRSSSVSSVPSC